MKRITLAVLILSGQAAAALASDAGLERLAVKLRMAAECKLSLSAEMDAWINEITRDVHEGDHPSLQARTADLVQDEFSRKGKIGACLDLRANLFRDGWL